MSMQNTLKYHFFPYVTSHVTLNVYECGINRRVLIVRIQKSSFKWHFRGKMVRNTLKTVKKPWKMMFFWPLTLNNAWEYAQKLICKPNYQYLYYETKANSLRILCKAVESVQEILGAFWPLILIWPLRLHDKDCWSSWFFLLLAITFNLTPKRARYNLSERI